MEQRQSQNDAQELVADFTQLVNQAKQLRNLKIDDLVLPQGTLDQLAKHFSKSLKATQLRRVFHDIKRLEQTARRIRSEEFSHIRTQLALTLPEFGLRLRARSHPQRVFTTSCAHCSIRRTNGFKARKMFNGSLKF